METETNVALLIPVFNDQDGLIRSVNSLRNETLPTTIIIVDDGSSIPIIPPTPPSPHKIELLRLPKNEGIEIALNHGINWAIENKYKYIARLDSGDINLPNRIKKQVDYLESHPECAMVGGQIKIIDEDNNEIAVCHYPTDYSKIVRVIHYRNPFAHPAIMYRTEIFLDIGMYSKNYPAAEDYELFFRITQKYCSSNLEDFVIGYTLNTKGISMQKRRKQLVSGLKIMLKYFDPWKPESYLGLIKNIVMLGLPNSLNWMLKKTLCPSRKLL